MDLNSLKDLKAKLDAAGYTMPEQIMGTLTAEVKAALMLQESAGGGFRAVMAHEAFGSVAAKLLAYTSAATKTDPRRIVAVSDLVHATVMETARKMVQGGATAADLPECGHAECAEQPTVPAVPTRLDASPAPTAKDIN